MSEDMTEHTPLPDAEKMEDLIRDYGMAEMSCGHDLSGPMDRRERERTREELTNAANALLARIRELEEALKETTDMLEAAVNHLQAWKISPTVNAGERIVANRAALNARG